MKQLRRLILLSLLSGCLATIASAQAGVRLDYVKPVGDLGAAFRPGPGITLLYSPSNTIRKFNGLFYVGAFRVTPQQDTLYASYAIEDFGRVFNPGYRIYEPYLFLRAGGEITYRLYVNKPFTPIGVVNLGGIGVTQRYEFRGGGVGETAHVYKGGLEGGLGLGVEYEINQTYSARFTVVRHAAVFVESGIDQFWNISLNGIYYW